MRTRLRDRRGEVVGVRGCLLLVLLGLRSESGEGTEDIC